MKVSPVGVALFRAAGETERKKDTMKLEVVV
jgi:hypothetical protein